MENDSIVSPKQYTLENNLKIVLTIVKMARKPAQFLSVDINRAGVQANFTMELSLHFLHGTINLYLKKVFKTSRSINPIRKLPKT